MNYEKLRLNVGYLLLGEKNAARFVMFFPKFLQFLQVALWLTGMFNARLFENKEYGLALSLVFGVASISLYFVTVSFQLLRDRWLFCRMKKSKTTLSRLFVGFSLRDFLLAVKLSAFSRVRCVLRAVLFMSFPLAVCVYCFELSGFEMSRAKWLVCAVGCALLLGLGLFFTVVSLCPIFYAKKFCCFDSKRTLKAFFVKTASLDVYSFRLLNFKLTFIPFTGAKKSLAGLIDARFLVSRKQKSTAKQPSVNKL